MLGAEIKHNNVEEEASHGELLDPNGFSLQEPDVPYVHYYPYTKSHGVGSTPGTFLPIPASKGVRKQNNDSSAASIISISFSIMGIDKVTNYQARLFLKLIE